MGAGCHKEIISYEELIAELNSLLCHCPELTPIACKKLQELIEELGLKMKIKEKEKAVKAKELAVKMKIEEKEKAVKEIVEVKCKELNPLDKIKHGFLKFKIHHFLKERELFEKLACNQHPKFLIFSCCDSRVDPCHILGLEMGEACVVRNVANLVAPFSHEEKYPSTGAALEYAILHLKVEHILVIGHTQCDGIKTLISSSSACKEDAHVSIKSKSREFVGEWVKINKHASKKTLESCSDASFEEQCTHCEKESVKESVSNCLTFPFVKRAVEESKLTLHGGYYDLVKGSFERWTLHYKHSKIEKCE